MVIPGSFTRGGASQRYRVGAAALLEVTQARVAQVEAAGAVVAARGSPALQGTVITCYVGDPASGSATT